MRRRILVDASVIGDAVNIRLESEIRDASFTLKGDIRIGLEFTGLSKTEQAVTAILGGIKTIEPKTAAPWAVR